MKNKHRPYQSPFGYIDLGPQIYPDIKIKKDSSMNYKKNNEYKYLVKGDWTEKGFDDFADAERQAKKSSHNEKEDIAIYKIDSVVRFPLDDYKVEKV